jgi:hypothetical protein
VEVGERSSEAANENDLAPFGTPFLIGYGGCPGIEG